MNKATQGLLLAVCVAQLAVPVWMIGIRERTLRTGTPYDFPTAPIDPADPFRGRYVMINIQGQVPTNRVDGDTRYGRKVYASVEVGEDGLARFTAASDKPPKEGDWLPGHTWWSDSNVTVRAEIDRFYMNEEDAPRAEAVYRDSVFQSQTSTVARVRIRGRYAVIEDVLINGVPLSELARAHGEASP